MNILGLLTVFLGFSGYFLGIFCAQRCAPPRIGSFVLCVLIVLAIPALVYDLYYFKVFGEPVWLYRLRTMPGTELLASTSGLLAGWAQVRLTPRLRLSSLGKQFLVPAVFALMISFPYLKPLFRPLPSNALREEWKGDACLQSSFSTCGPASAATVIRKLGGHLTEHELAREAFTSKSGTENWYLARALRSHGFTTAFIRSNPSTTPLPAIAGVRLRNIGGSGHFIALLDRRADKLVVSDPMEGLSTNTIAELEQPYEFTGFFLLIGNPNSSRNSR